MIVSSFDPLFFIAAGLTEDFKSLSLHGKSAEGRLFTFTKDIEPLADDEVVGTIEAIQKRFEQEFAPQCARLAHYLHERMAKGSKIEESHASWQRSHEPLAAAMAEAKSRLKSYYKYIPLLHDTQKIMRAASSMLYLEVLTDSLEQKNKSLCSLLASQQHKSALSTYKSQVKACEGLGKSAPIEEKVSTLTKIFTDTKKQHKTACYQLQGKDESLAQETLSLYEEVFLFCRYTANCLAKELPQDATSNKLAALASSIQKKLPPHLAGILDAHEQPENPMLCENLYVESCTSTALPAQNYFRNGMWGASLLYSDLKQEIDKLQNIAKALYKLSCTLQERIKQLSSGQTEAASGFSYLDAEAAHYPNLINGLERLIYAQLRQLAKKPLSQKGHAGWYYVASLLAQIKDLRVSAEQFTQLATGPYRFCIQALGKLIRYLDVAHTYEGIVEGPLWLEPITRLFEATEAARSLSVKPFNFHKRAFKVIHQSIATVGTRTLMLSERDAQIPSRLFTIAPFDVEEYEHLPSYLYKNALRLTRFVESPCDPEFEVALHILRHDETHEPHFSSILKTTPTIDQLLTTYIRKSNINDYYIELELMKYACKALEAAKRAATGEINRYAAVLGYYEARQLLEDLKDHKRQRFATRLEWLERSIKAFATEHDALLNIDQELEHSSCKSLFRPLITALFSSNISASDAATDQIIHEINHRNFTTPEASSLLGLLLQQWGIKNSQKL